MLSTPNSENQLDASATAETGDGLTLPHNMAEDTHDLASRFGSSNPCEVRHINNAHTASYANPPTSRV